jgi:alpha/beta superfamily hydrolase
MGSGGRYGGGISEVLDVRAAIARAAEEVAAVIVVGWSFGASVALNEAVADERPRALALVGLPLEAPDVEVPSLPDAAALRSLHQPVLLLCGDRDRFCAPARMAALGRLIPRASTLVVPEANHFFSRRERDAAEAIGSFVDRSLSEPETDRN